MPSLDDEPSRHDLRSVTARVFEHTTQVHFVESAILHASQKVRGQLEFPRPPRWPLSCRQIPLVLFSASVWICPTTSVHQRPLTDSTAGRRVLRLVGRPDDARVLRMTLRARVRAGRLVVDEPTDLPEGTEIELLALDPGDWLDETDRAALHQALRESDADVAAGRLVEAEAILKELRAS